jgi:hypothetical protein
MNQIIGAQVKVMDGEEWVLVSLLLDLDSNLGVPRRPPSKYKINNFAVTKCKNRFFPPIIFYYFGRVQSKTWVGIWNQLYRCLTWFFKCKNKEKTPMYMWENLSVYAWETSIIEFLVWEGRADAGMEDGNHKINTRQNCKQRWFSLDFLLFCPNS